MPANTFKTLFLLLTLLATCTQWVLHEKKVSRYTPIILGLWTRGSSESAILICGRILACARSGVNNVIDDFGVDINSEFSHKKRASSSNRYWLVVLVLIVLLLILFVFRDLWKEMGWLQFSDPYRTTSSTTGGWSHWNILYIYIFIYILRSLIFWTLRMAYFLVTRSPVFVYISIFASTLCMCVMYLTSIWRILLMTNGLNAVWSNDRAAPTDTNPNNLELAPPQSVTATRLDQLVYSPNYYIQIFQTQPFSRSEDWTLNRSLEVKVQCAYQLRYGSNHSWIPHGCHPRSKSAGLVLSAVACRYVETE